MNQKLITITTDFGDDFASSQLKAVLYSLGFAGQIIENHSVKPFEIIEGAYGIWQLAKYCPPGTIHLGVVDPGVGSDRLGIVIKTRNFWFVGPDNGLLYPAAHVDGIEKIWQIDESKFDKVAKTFHGRDIFVKQAVYLAQDQNPKGEVISKIEELNFQEGQVLHIDAYGNIKYWGQNTFGLPVGQTFSDVAPNQPVILNGSSDTQELAVNLASAAQRFGLKLGQIIEKL